MIDLINDISMNQVIKEACILNYNLIKKPMVKKNIDIRLHYNLIEFYNKILLGEKTKNYFWGI